MESLLLYFNLLSSLSHEPLLTKWAKLRYVGLDTSQSFVPAAFSAKYVCVSKIFGTGRLERELQTI
jgi:hypothetical protein